MKFTKGLNEIRKEDVAIAGGKGASLGEMARIGIPVPDGFVILSDTFNKFLEESDLNVEIDSIFHSVKKDDINTIENASEQIGSLIINAKVPKNISEEILRDFKKLNSKYVAVRSSATSEDSADAAWAGQLDSYLNTPSEKLLDNIKKCWASLFTPRAIFYRFDKYGEKTHLQKISVAVIVQKMIESEVSGIAFSVHPVTQDKNQIIIEAGFGLGEAIVSGQITPDSYVIEKEPLRIIDKKTIVQKNGLYLSKGGGNKWIDLVDGKIQKLSDEKILELTRIILKIESHYNFPCDIEWAYEKKEFHIVQSRPITTLSKEGKIKKELKWVKEAEISLEDSQNLFLLNDILLYPITSEVEKRTGLDEGVISYIDREEKSNKIYTSQDDRRGDWGYNFFLDENKLEKFLQEVQEIYAKSYEFQKKMNNLDLENISLMEIKKIFVEDIKTLNKSKVLTFFTIDPYSWKIEESLKKDLSKIVPGEELENTLGTLVLQEEKDSLEEERYVWLKNIILPAIKNNVKQDEIKRDSLILDKTRNHFEKYKSYSSGFGMKMGDMNYYLNLLGEDLNKKNEELEREYFELENKAKINQGKKEEIRKKFNISSDIIKKAQVLGKLSNLRLDLRVLSWSFYIHIFNQLLKTCSKKAGLSELEINSLTYNELIKLLDNNLKVSGDLKESINKRKNTNILQMYYPGEGLSILLDEEAKNRFYLEVGHEKKLDDSDVIEGDVACRKGTVRGEVFKFNYGSSDFVKRISEFPEGSILVANVTMPVLMPAIRKAKAMVTDGGGITCHAAIVSRELGIPCIIGTNVATKLLEDGDFIEVDTVKGIVRILGKKI